MKNFFRNLLTLRSIGVLRKLSLNFTGLIPRNRGRSLIFFAVKLGRLVTGKLSSGMVRSIATFIIRVRQIQIKQGTRGVVTYLKVSQVILMKICGGDYVVSTLALGCNIARDRRGYPRLIPAIHRKQIRAGNLKLLKLWMTLFSLYRVLEYQGKFSIQTIIAPSVAKLDTVLDSFNSFLPLFLSALASLSSRWMDLKQISPDRGSRASAAVGETKPFYIPTASPIKIELAVKGIRPNNSSFMSLVATAIAWDKLDSKEKSQGVPENARLYRRLKEFCYATNQLWVFQLIFAIQTWISVRTSKPLTKEKNSDPLWFQCNIDSKTVQDDYLGQLALKDEPAGKVRVFALVDVFSQWVLKGLHDCIFDILREIPQDGTFDQSAPIKALFLKSAPKDRFFSMDLTAATDRLPVTLQRMLLASMFGDRMANAWEGLLVSRDYILRDPRITGSKPVVRYSVGQPMGAYSSWALLALFHHFIVQWAWYRVMLRDFPTEKYRWYTKYAILGDDVLISGTRVSKEYRVLLDALGAPINLHKSVLGVKPVGEFAKKFVVSGVDCSPVSWREASIASRNFFVALQLRMKLPHCGLGPFLSLVGVGPFAKTRIAKNWSTLSLRLETYISMFYSPLFTDSTWLDWFLRTDSTTVRTVEDDVLRYAVMSFVKFCQAEAKASALSGLASMKEETIVLNAVPYPHEGAKLNGEFYVHLNAQSQREALFSSFDEYSRLARLVRFKLMDKFVDDRGPAEPLIAGAVSTYLAGLGVSHIAAPKGTGLGDSPYTADDQLCFQKSEVSIEAERAHKLFSLRRSFVKFLTEAKARKVAGQPLTQGRL